MKMREILFRGKTEKGKWVYGVPIYLNKEAYIVRDFCLGGDYTDDLVEAKTIGQFCGLLDKNGKKVFEGDIVKAIICVNDWSRDATRNEEGIYEIKYHTQHCYFFLAKEGNNLLFDGNWSYYLKEIKVIGNIHDKTELLRGGE
jgi:uncharacterized phage protein (TIGR01671 family)